jgi:hypothetical protein
MDQVDQVMIKIPFTPDAKTRIPDKQNRGKPSRKKQDP